MKRRRFLVNSTTAIGVASAPLSVFAFSANQAGKDLSTNEIAIVDSRIQNSQAILEQCCSSKIPVHTFSADITQLWANILAPQMTTSAPVITGHTSQTCLHCLIPLAAGMGYYLDSKNIESGCVIDNNLTAVSWVMRPTRQTRLNSLV